MGIEGEEIAEPTEPCWPFWGLLRTTDLPSPAQGVGRTSWAGTHRTQVDVFGRLTDTAWQALRMLKRRSICELRAAASEIQSEIDGYVDHWIEAETESLAKILFERGGYQLGYLPEAAHGSENEIRNLLINWSCEWDDSSGLPKRDDLTDLEALSDCLGFREFDKAGLIHFGLVEPEEYEFYAVLTLMIVCDAIHSNPLPGYSKLESLSGVLAIGCATINAIDAISYADRIQFEEKIRKAIVSEQPAILAVEIEKRIKDREAEVKQRLSKAGEDGAKVRHALSTELKAWALRESRSIKGLPADKARELMKKIPALLSIRLKEAGNRLKDPERVIRDALSAERNKPATGSQPNVTDG